MLKDSRAIDLFWNVCQELRIPPRVEEYELLVLAIESDLAPQTNPELKDLCRRLWVKSVSDRQRFEEAFDQYFKTYWAELTQAYLAAQPRPISSEQSVEQSPLIEPTDKPASPPPPIASSPRPKPPPKTIPPRLPETSVAQAIAASPPSNPLFADRPFALDDEYFRPLTRQQLIHGWRSLRSPELAGLSDAYDIPATVERYSKVGFLEELLRLPKRVNRTQVLMFVDRSNSMLPFELQADRLISTARKARADEDLQGLSMCYFRNYIQDKVYLDPAMRYAVQLEEELSNQTNDRALALVFSDAGAARGGYSPQRISSTQRFLSRLRESVSEVVWLNPCPEELWTESSAVEIGRDVQMYAYTLNGWRKLAKALKSQAQQTRKPSSLHGTERQTNEAQKRKLAALKTKLETLAENSTDSERDKQAIEQILHFLASHPDSIELLCHIAFPLALTPELAYFLRENFPQSRQTDWFVIPDLFLSGLCRVVGYQLYEIDSRVRHLLLKYLYAQRHLGKSRLQQLSDCLLYYIQTRLEESSLDPKDFGERPEWMALAFTEPNALARKLAETLKRNYGNKAELMRLASMAIAMSTPLVEANFEPLLMFSRGMGRLARGDQSGAAALFARVGETMPVLNVQGIELSAPGFLKTLEFQTAVWTDWPEIREEDVNVVTVRFGAPVPEFVPFTFQVATVTQSDSRHLQINRHESQAEGYVEHLGDGIELTMMAIPAGSFMMGSPDEERDRVQNESPRHRENIPAFCMSMYPVTQAQWRYVAENLPQEEMELKADLSAFKGELRPVEQVNWFDAKEFCSRLEKLTGRRYRLPSEAEWEYACRAGTETPFHFGKTIARSLANYVGDYTYDGGRDAESREQTTQVGYFGHANAYGLYDMHGNVWEWCEDLYHDSYDRALGDGRAWVENSDKEAVDRIVRGGSWADFPRVCRSAYRHHFPQQGYHYCLGFRVVSEDPRALQ